MFQQIRDVTGHKFMPWSCYSNVKIWKHFAKDLKNIWWIVSKNVAAVRQATLIEITGV